MGLMSRLFGVGDVVRGVGDAVGSVAEVFTPNRTEAARQAHSAFTSVMGQYQAEFARPARTWFDVVIDGANRVPRPALALSTIALFAYAMAEPVGFAARMQGLALVPEPLWWLMGAVISFYFGARELHHARSRFAPAPSEAASVVRAIREIEALEPEGEPTSVPLAAPRTDAVEDPADDNPIVAAFRAGT